MTDIIRRCIVCDGKVYETSRSENLRWGIPTISIHWLCKLCGRSSLMVLQENKKLSEGRE
jgi:hypothetical protein